MKKSRLSKCARHFRFIAAVSLGLSCTTYAHFLEFNVSKKHDVEVVRLTQLDPNSPSGYFTYGETLLAYAENAEEKALAKQVLAVGIGLAADNNLPELAASMCIVLADGEDSTVDAINLWDLALMLDPMRSSAWQKHRNQIIDQDLQVRQIASRCIHAARFYMPEQASELLKVSGVTEAIQTASEQSAVDPALVLNTLRMLIQQASTDTCHGRVFVTRRGEGVVNREVCPDHARPIGTSISQESFNNLIRVESVLLAKSQGHQRSVNWGDVTYLQLDAPAQDPSVSMILKQYGVDISMPYWKNGQWDSSR